MGKILLIRNGKEKYYSNTEGVRLLRKSNPKEKFRIAICKHTKKEVVQVKDGESWSYVYMMKNKEEIMGKIYKVYCEYFVRADRKIDVERLCEAEENFVEKHIIVKEATPTEFTNDPQEEVYADLTKE